MKRPIFRRVLREPERRKYEDAVITNERGFKRTQPFGPWDRYPRWLTMNQSYLPTGLAALLVYIARVNYGIDMGPRKFRRFSARRLGYETGSNQKSPLNLHFTQVARLMREAVNMGLLVELEPARGRRAGAYEINCDEESVAPAIDYYVKKAIAARERRSCVARKGLRSRRGQTDLRSAPRYSERSNKDATQNAACVAPEPLHPLKESYLKESCKKKGGAPAHPPARPAAAASSDLPLEIGPASALELQPQVSLSRDGPDRMENEALKYLVRELDKMTGGERGTA